MKKILFYIDHRNRGGAQRVMVELANYFSAHYKYKIIFATQISSTEQAYKLNPDIKEVVLENKNVKNFVRKQMYRIRALSDLCGREKPDIVISFLIITNIIALIAGKRNRIPVLISVRNDPAHDHSGILHYLMRYFYPGAAGWVFQTEGAKEYFKSWIKGESDTILNPVSMEVLKEIEHGRITGENQNNIVAVGRLDKQKRHDLLINAYYKAYGRNSDTKLVIYGEGEERANLEQRIRELGIEEKVVLAGITEHVVEKIRSAKMFVLSSDYEGMPNALLEAMAAGLPVISTDCPCGGPAMLIEDGKNGFLIPTGDGAMLCKKMTELSEEEETAYRMGREAVKIREKCDIDRISRQWEEIIQKCIRNGK